MGCSLPGSSVLGILQARILEWVPTSFSRGFSWPRNQTWVSCIAGRFFTNWATREALCSAKQLQTVHQWMSVFVFQIWFTMTGSWTTLRNYHFIDFSKPLFIFSYWENSEKAMAPYAVFLPGESHGRRSLVGGSPWGRSLRVRHDWVTSFSLFTFMHWRRKWQPTPVFLPGESHGWG